MNPLPDASIIALDPGDGGRIDQDDLVYVVHPSDLIAVEQAVCLKEQAGLGQVILVAISSPSAERLLRQCLAIGADEAVLIRDLSPSNPDGHAIGTILAKCCRAMDFDLILFGHGALERLGGQTGYVMADLLGLPIVSRVTGMSVFSERNDLAVERKLDRGYRERLETSLPAVLTLEEGLNRPRYPSLTNMLEALRKEVRRIDGEDLVFSPAEEELKRPRLELLHMKEPKPRPKRIFTPDSSLSAEDRMWQIMSGGLDEKNRELFEGSPEELSLKFVEYLAQIGIEIPAR